MANIIIQNRLKKLTATKRHLLTLKKDQRGDGLKVTNDMIARLKRWDKELKEQRLIKLNIEAIKAIGMLSDEIIQETMEVALKQSKTTKQAIKSIKKRTSEAVKEFKKACGIVEPTFCESFSYPGVNYFGR